VILVDDLMRIVWQHTAISQTICTDKILSGAL